LPEVTEVAGRHVRGLVAEVPPERREVEQDERRGEREHRERRDRRRDGQCQSAPAQALKDHERQRHDQQPARILRTRREPRQRHRRGEPRAPAVLVPREHALECPHRECRELRGAIDRARGQDQHRRQRDGECGRRARAPAGAVRDLRDAEDGGEIARDTEAARDQPVGVDRFRIRAGSRLGSRTNP
jgi:hypothetical protein